MRWMVAGAAVLLAGCASPHTNLNIGKKEALTETVPRCTPMTDPNIGCYEELSANLGSEAINESALQAAERVRSGEYLSESVVESLASRIAEYDNSGPQINAIMSLLPDVSAEASMLDKLRYQQRLLGPLHGIPVLLKDNIAIAGQPTTAGSLALKDNIAAADAPLVARLREAGLVILGRTNLSEWANIRSTNSTSGWSAVGGLTVNPWGAGRNACGSSSGSAAAVAAGFAPLAIGTETDGSITCPAGVNGVVGFKPSLGVVSGVGVVPIAHSQDTAGPIARTVADAAALLDAMSDGEPFKTSHGPLGLSEGYMARLDKWSLQGTRVGVLRDRIGEDAEILAAFDTALGQLRQAGATIVEIADSRSGLDGMGDAELVVLLAELKSDMAAYLATTDPARVPSRTLADLIAFNKANPEELRYFNQDLFEQAEAGPTACPGGLSSGSLMLTGLSQKPATVERLVVRPIEAHLMGAPGVASIHSSAEHGRATVTWEVDPNGEQAVGLTEASRFAKSVVPSTAQVTGSSCVSSPAYREALAKSKGLAKGKLASLLADNNVAVLVGVTNGPAWLSTLGEGDNFSGPSVSDIPAIAGAPHLTVPMALVRGLPVGLSFIGAIGDDARVLSYGAAFEAVRPPFPTPPLAP